MAELGMVAAQGRDGVKELIAIVMDERNDRLPSPMRDALRALVVQLSALQEQIGVLEKRIRARIRREPAGDSLARRV